MRSQLVQQRQHKRGRLATAGARHTNHIIALCVWRCEQQAGSSWVTIRLLLWSSL
jgi:hypothetical protein